MKSQVIVNQKTKQIMCTAYGKGREHDFKLFKRSKTHLLEPTFCLGDKGYQGIQKIHKESKTPHKKPRKGKLSLMAKTAKSPVSFN